jgi:hypothetical protein
MAVVAFDGRFVCDGRLAFDGRSRVRWPVLFAFDGLKANLGKDTP